MAKFNFLLALSCVSALFSFVAADGNSECQKITDAVEGIDVKCEFDVNNDLESIELSDSALTQSIIDAVASATTLKSLTLNKVSIPEELNIEKLHLSKLSYTDVNSRRKKIYSIGGEPVAKNFLKTLKNVDEIEIQGFLITQDALKDLSALTNLKSLSFSKNYFSLDLDYSVLKKAKSLTSLTLETYKGDDEEEKNQTVDYAANEKFLTSLCEVRKLKQLSITRFPISKLPSCIGDLTKLENLNLAFNSLSEIPKQFGDLYRLKQLKLNDNQLPEFSKAICELDRLEVLYLNDNKIQKIPSCIENLYKLKEL